MTKSEVINKIINQVNSLNKKIKTFKNEGIEDHYEFITSMFNDKQMKYNKSGSLTKSKKFYDKENILQLNRTLNILTKINNHDVFGTIKKYKKFANDQWYTFKETISDSLIKKGYDEEYVKLITSSKQFQKNLSLILQDCSRGYGSEQIFEKVFLNYQHGIISKEDIEKAVSDIEHSVSRQNQLQDHIREYNEFLEMKRGKR